MERILEQEVAYIRYGKLPIPKQGGHVKVASWLTDEGTMLTIREYMSQAGEAKAVTNYWGQTYDEEISRHDDQLPMISITGIQRRIKLALSSRSARAWLLKLGWNWKEVKRGVYHNGHERADPRMLEWDETLTIIEKEQVVGVKPIVFITHDECTFNSNDGRKRIWIHNDKAPLRKKGRGQGLHVSDFLTPVGRLGGGDVCEIMKCGGDVWWTGELMLKQLTEKAIPAFEKAFPGCQGLFAFDNAKIHQKYAPDALQSMMGRDGRLKGLQIVLQERGLWPSGRKFLTQCSIPGDSPGERKPNPACKHATNANCCARALLSSQPDFQAQKCQLQETLEAAGHMVIFYPVYHCELNFIEYFWGRAKVYTRAHCEYSFPALVRIVPIALAQISDVLIWKYYQRTLRMMDAYRNNIVYGSEDFKKQISESELL
ncbi:hypothetical protein L873DRAFT_1825217 [Choiromyces venosus 120613-1]|uniref:Uncharacterized protein n=1 Tax=Choiromyces venosus 120613-1 TaxID=1336337 RepID=A0A3N4K4K9_9PEZI|nr:hypothetical protein L873DRAFT_1825217 [Choiromyces venosus 120613-1]